MKIKTYPFLINGMFHSATGYIAALFQQYDLPVGHETLKKYGMSSWQYGYPRAHWQSNVYPKLNTIQPKNTIIDFKYKIVVLRNPVKLINNHASRFLSKNFSNQSTRLYKLFGNTNPKHFNKNNCYEKIIQVNAAYYKHLIYHNYDNKGADFILTPEFCENDFGDLLKLLGYNNKPKSLPKHNVNSKRKYNKIQSKKTEKELYKYNKDDFLFLMNLYCSAKNIIILNNKIKNGEYDAI